MTVPKSASKILFLFLALSSCISAHGEKPVNTSSSCRKFVGRFYSWYATNASQDLERDGGVALKHRPSLFSPAIVQALRADDEAQEKAGSNVVSLDGDPFVGGDGLADGYKVEKVEIVDGRCWAQVHAVVDGMENQAPDVTPELEIKNNKWVFVNFYFPSPSNPKAWNLLSALNALRNEQR